jgi:hypothetical protein
MKSDCSFFAFHAENHDSQLKIARHRRVNYVAVRDITFVMHSLIRTGAV